jgi:hypothetical protein
MNIKFHFSEFVLSLMEVAYIRKRGVFVQPSQLSVFMGEPCWQCAQMILFVSMIGLNAG